ncbi:MAG: flagellin [Paracoccus sp. (in: a-proteobacteria)]|uniref:flagellin n=1 Tax=Paracoccus sp. TaxID=267 RepID=UPI0026DEDFB3|nr:flagellin [Paracoccus sp. (in: a-proteobacteria)]MDO5620886.1 flagellin [Paracoccus sp. (in: a-proteobacteria)]
MGYADLLRSGVFSRTNQSLKSSIVRSSQEAITGLSSDPLARVGGNVAALAQIDSRQNIAEVEKQNIDFAATRLEIMQVTLESVRRGSENAAQHSLAENALANRSMIDLRSAEADKAFAATVDKLNVRHGNDYLFSGQAVDQAAIPDSDFLKSKIFSLVDGKDNAADIIISIEEWFSDAENGFLAMLPVGSERVSSALVDREAVVDVTSSAKKSGILNVMAGMAMSLIAGQRPDLDDKEVRKLVESGSKTTLKGAHQIRSMQAEIGSDQERVDALSVSKNTEIQSIKKMRNDMLGVDQYDAITALNEQRAALERLYAATARLNELSLVNYLR